MCVGVCVHVCLWVPKKLVLRIISFRIFVNAVKKGVYSQHLAPLGSECCRERTFNCW